MKQWYYLIPQTVWAVDKLIRQILLIVWKDCLSTSIRQALWNIIIPWNNFIVNLILYICCRSKLVLWLFGLVIGWLWILWICCWQGFVRGRCRFLSYRDICSANQWTSFYMIGTNLGKIYGCLRIFFLIKKMGWFSILFTKKITGIRQSIIPQSLGNILVLTILYSSWKARVIFRLLLPKSIRIPGLIPGLIVKTFSLSVDHNSQSVSPSLATWVY